MLSYEEFKEKMAEQIRSRLPSEYQGAEVRIIRLPENNDESLEGVMVRPKEIEAGALLFCEDAYADYLHTKSMEGTLAACMEILVSHLKNLPKIEVEKYRDFDVAKGKILPELVSVRKNCRSLGYLARKPIEGTDLAVVYRVLQDEGEMRVSSKISNDLMESWGADLNTIHNLAFENMKQLLTPQIVELELRASEGKEPIVHCNLPNCMSRESVYIFTNQEKFCGASSIMAEGVLADMAERLECSFYILPLSVEEMMVLPKTEEHDMKQLQKLLIEYNMAGESTEYVLSDQVYFYDASQKELSMVTDPEHTQEVILELLKEYADAALQEETGEMEY